MRYTNLHYTSRGLDSARGWHMSKRHRKPSRHIGTDNRTLPWMIWTRTSTRLFYRDSRGHASTSL
jgi:hypothetical protein